MSTLLRSDTESQYTKPGEATLWPQVQSAGDRTAPIEKSPIGVAQHQPLKHVLICGLGSAGMRHMRHFRALGVTTIDAYRTGLHTITNQANNAPDRVFDSLSDALSEGPQAVIVANPTSLHIRAGLAAIRSGAHVFLEKPLSNELVGCDELLNEARERGLVIMVGCNLRFHPLLLSLKSIIEQGEMGKPLEADAHFGTYLPDWHPWEDYRKSYAARRDLGGGATLTHIHEIDYLTWLFGPAVSVFGTCLKGHRLGTDVDETSNALILHQGGTQSRLRLSICEKPAQRWVNVTFERGAARLDFLDNSLTVQSESWGRIIRVPEGFDFDLTYRDQASAFAEAVAGRSSADFCDGDHALADLKVALEILHKRI